MLSLSSPVRTRPGGKLSASTGNDSDNNSMASRPRHRFIMSMHHHTESVVLYYAMLCTCMVIYNTMDNRPKKYFLRHIPTVTFSHAGHRDLSSLDVWRQMANYLRFCGTFSVEVLRFSACLPAFEHAMACSNMHVRTCHVRT